MQSSATRSIYDIIKEEPNSPKGNIQNGTDPIHILDLNVKRERELMYSIGRMYTLEQSRMGSFATTIDINKLEQ